MRIGKGALAVLVLAAMLAPIAVGAPAADARPAKCFGKKINRVVNGSNKTVRLKYGDIAWVSGNRVTVIGKPYTVVCANKGRQTVRASKGRALISTGDGDDRIILHTKSANSKTGSLVYAGLGNDVVYGSKSHDTIYASPKKNPRNKPDRDVIYGRGGNDTIYDYSGVGNRLYGESGSDHIYSLGNAVSDVYGGDGSDFLFTTGGKAGGRMERLFGERGNDRLDGRKAPTNGPAYLDPGVGDDWIWGTNADDIIISQSGITKIEARGGNDLILSGTRGKSTADGGPGKDTVSYAPHTPPKGGNGGVTVNLQAGTARGQFSNAPWHSVKNIENVEGSAFDDTLTGKPGVNNRLEGGLGNDELNGNTQDDDTADGGHGQNDCYGFKTNLMNNCNGKSPGEQDPDTPLVDVNRSGILTVLGSDDLDRIKVGYQPKQQRYIVNLNRQAETSGRCVASDQSGKVVHCPAPINLLSSLVVHSHKGNDRIEIALSVPASVTTSLNGGPGKSTLIGGNTKDFMETAEGQSAGSVLKGRSNSDVIYMDDRVDVFAGNGSDVIHTRNVCRGGNVSGGPGKDNLVFAGSPQGVDANLERATAKWVNGNCASPLKMKRDIENLEGSPNNDRLTLGRKFKSQQGNRSLLGREGHDTLNSKNGVRDTVTTGSTDQGNTVISDPIDKVIWGWGLAGY